MGAGKLGSRWPSHVPRGCSRGAVGYHVVHQRNGTRFYLKFQDFLGYRFIEVDVLLTRTRRRRCAEANVQ